MGWALVKTVMRLCHFSKLFFKHVFSYCMSLTGNVCMMGFFFYEEERNKAGLGSITTTKCERAPHLKPKKIDLHVRHGKYSL